MRDAISFQRAAQLHPKVKQEVIDTITEIENTKFPKNIAIRIVQGLRSIDEQNELYAQGRTKPGKIVTNAKGGKSFHNFGVAIDFAILYDKDGNGTYETISWDTVKDGDMDGLKDWDEVRTSFEAKGWEWGGKWRTFKDLPHLQKTFGLTVNQMLTKYTKKDFISNTQYVNI